MANRVMGSAPATPAATTRDFVLDEHALGWRAHLPQLHDPGKASLRRATRAALLVPALFAVCSWLAPKPQLITFATFGAFALLVLGDFGGSSRRRAGAYAVTAAVGCSIVSAGTLASTTPWTAAAVVGLGGFVLQFMGIFGGYATAAQLPLLLGLVLSVAIPAPPEQIPLRLAGWLLGSALALLGGVFLWPRHEHETLREAAAETCQALAHLVAALYGRSPSQAEVDRQRQRAQAALDKLRQVYRVTPHRPAGPTRPDRAYAELVDELGRELKLLPDATPASRAADGTSAAADALAARVVDVLRASAGVLRGERSAPDLARLDGAREEHHQALDNRAAERLQAGVEASVVLQDLEAGRPLKVVSYVTLAIGANATLAAGLALDQPQDVVMPREVESAAGVSAGVRRATGSIRTHLRLSSIWCRNSLRAAVGLSLAVLLVDLVGLDHAFWAVLGTLSVLRSNALATGRTALAAVVGTALGILPASLLLIPLGTQTTVLWAAFPAAVFVAAYAPSVIGFVAGQAAFTLLVVILFNLIQPVGWTLGLVRLQDVLIGTGMSLVVGGLFWPRGARGQVRTALGSLYRRNAAYVQAAFGFVLGARSADECLAARQAAAAEAARAGEVFDQFLDDRAAKMLPPATWAALQAGGSHLLLAGDSLERLASHGYQVKACGDAARVLSRAVETVVDQLESVSESLERGLPSPSSPGSAVPDDALANAAIECLGAWRGGSDPDRRGSALGLVAASDWVHSLGLLLDHLSGPATAAVRIANLAWWR